MQSLCHQFACSITKIDYPHDKTILDKAPSHTPMGKPDNGEDLAGTPAAAAGSPYLDFGARLYNPAASSGWPDTKTGSHGVLVSGVGL